jgi:superfamily II DNA or RNA helicase
MNTYLGQKGYTISKSELSIEKQLKIRNDLTIKPFTMGSPMNDPKTFPAYRESPNKFYVPHYYGIEKFGSPKQYKISEGVNINLEFNGAPRDYQEQVINKFIQHCLSVGFGGGLLELHTGWGKTCAGLYILSILKKKTIIIVHKEFLMNQWIERIQHFLPSAKIGKIQGPVIDTEKKDIVLCMLQSLVMKDYDQKIFDEFGLTIIDEVHHISSQSFSNSLFKLVTKYMLGLSATMNRKDGTTDVFKMFLGNVIHKAERKNDTLVEVRAINYKVDDESFNDTILDFRGKPQNSSMITKICEYSRRTEFIIKVLCDFIQVEGVDQNVINGYKCEMDKNNPNCELCNKNNNYLVKNSCCDCVKYCMPCLDKLEPFKHDYIDEKGSKKQYVERIKCPNCKKVLKYLQNYIENKYVKPLETTHTIIMAHNLNILHYIYNKFVCKNLASIGYYIGGMSEAELKKSEKKQVILATYSMSAEGLDIPTLNAEFLITPKTDIVQSVGRILRAKHAFSHPIIYDFIDSHDLFQRQWLKRKTYFKKQNYKIIGTNNKDYGTNYSLWKNIYNPKDIGSDKLSVNKKTMGKKKTSIKSHSSTDKSITIDSDEESSDNEEMPKDKYQTGICFLKIK